MMTNTFSRVYNRFFDAVTTPGVRSSVVIVILCAVTVILFSYGDPGVAQVAMGKKFDVFQIFTMTETVTTFSNLVIFQVLREYWAKCGGL